MSKHEESPRSRHPTPLSISDPRSEVGIRCSWSLDVLRRVVFCWVAVGVIGGTDLWGQIVFTDISAQAGVELSELLVESVAWGDYDGDGDQDLYLTGDGPNHLFRNEGGGVFTEVGAEVGVDFPGFSVGTAWGDLDNDGDVDLYVVNFGIRDLLYRNDGPVGPGGAWQFTEVAIDAGVTEESSSRGMAFLDFDRDGLLDIYVNAIGADILYHNLGGLTFENVAAMRGIVGVDGLGVGVVASDIDGDGWVDLFTGNRSGMPNVLFHNEGGSFSDITATAGITETGLGMGVLAFDYDRDLDIDLYWTVWPGMGEPVANALYQRSGVTEGGIPTFTNTAAASGTTDVGGWGISCNAGDIDNDGWQDFAVTNGFDDTSSPNALFHNQLDGTFADITAVLGGGAFDGRGVAFADFDDDGDLDLCLTADIGAPTRLWRNDTVNNNRWLIVELEGRQSNRSGIGARIQVTTDLGSQIQEVSGGAGRGSQNSLPVEFGLGQATTLLDIRIVWPSGIEQILADIALDQKITVVEGVFFSDGFESGDTSGWGMAVGMPRRGR